MANLGPKAKPIETPLPSPDGGPVSARPLPEMEDAATRAARGPRLLATAPFVFIHHPDSWQVQAGKLVPCLNQARIKAGLNSVSMRGAEGRIDAGKYTRKKEAEGWICLTSHALRQFYCICYINDKGQEVWLDRWSKPVPGSDHVIPDEAGYTTWLSELVANGTLPDIRRHVLEQKIDKLKSQLEEEADGYIKSPTRGKRLHADLAVLQAEWEAGRGT